MALGRRNPEREAAQAAASAEREARKRAEQEEKNRQAYLRTPVGKAETAFERGDHVFQYAHNVMSQEAVIVAMVGSTTRAQSADPSVILNAVCSQGWELINGSFVFVEQGQQSRDKFMSSGQNIAVKGVTMGYYLFRRCQANRNTPPIQPRPAIAAPPDGWNYDTEIDPVPNSQQ